MTDKKLAVSPLVAGLTSDINARDFLSRLERNFNRRHRDFIAHTGDAVPPDDQIIAFRIDHPKGQVRLHFYTLDEKKPADQMIVQLPNGGDEGTRYACEKLAAQYLIRRGLCDKAAAMTHEHLAMIMRKRLRKLVSQDPHCYDAQHPSGAHGVYNVKVDEDHYTYNGADRMRYGLLFQIAPASFAEQQAVEYISPPIRWEISLNTDSSQYAHFCMQEIKARLQEEGFHEYIPARQKAADPKIDPHTIDINAIYIDSSGQWRKNSPAIVLRRSSTTNSALVFSTNTESHTYLETMLERCKEFIADHQKSGTPFTMPELKQHARKDLPLNDKQSRPTPRKSDIREIRIDSGPVKMRLLTPVLHVKENGDFSATLRFAPADTAGHTVGSSETTISLGTNDREQAMLMIDHLQDVTEAATRAYFSKKPDIHLATEFQQRTNGSGTRSVPVFVVPRILTERSDGQTYFHEIRDELLNSLQHWQSFVRLHFEKSEVKDGQVQLHITPSTLQHTPVNGRLSPLGDGFTLIVPADKCEAFCQQLTEAFNQQQFDISRHAEGEKRDMLMLRGLSTALRTCMTEQNATLAPNSPNAQTISMMARKKYIPQLPLTHSHEPRESSLAPGDNRSYRSSQSSWDLE